MMDHLDEFKLKQIVWAKVADHPWWPARIVKTDKHADQNIYRVHFFGDPTYCFLKESSLLDFQTGLLSFKEIYSTDLKMRKPIQLATLAFRKEILNIKNRQSMNIHFQQHQQNIVDIFDQTKTETKPLIENIRKSPQKIQQPIQLLKSPKKVFSLPTAVTTENVIEILQGPCLKQLKSRRWAHNRRQIMTFKQSLRDRLLEKYSLHNFEEKNPKKPALVYRRKKIIKNRSKIGKNLAIKDQNKAVIRKLKDVIKRYISNEQAMKYSIKIGQKMWKTYGKSSSGYRRSFRCMIMWLNNTRCSNIDEFSTFLEENSDLKKSQSDEKSKLTQILMEHGHTLAA